EAPRLEEAPIRGHRQGTREAIGERAWPAGGQRVRGAEDKGVGALAVSGDDQEVARRRGLERASEERQRVGRTAHTHLGPERRDELPARIAARALRGLA